jgi:hypothetical protein
VANLSILIPEATTNYIENPSIRFDTTGWTADGSTVSRTLNFARFGIASLKVVTSGLVIREGVYYRVNTLSAYSESVTVSAYIRGTGHVRIRLTDEVTTKEWASKELVLEETRWQRISVIGRISSSNDVRLYVETYGSAAQSVTFYVDAAQLELKPYPTSYCDGTRPGCRWNGLYDESTSYRSPYTREGGIWKMISGAEREREDIYMTVVQGLGVAPIQNNTQSYSMAPGGFLDNVKIEERPIILKFHTKHKNMARTCKQALSLENLHELRQMLIDIIKPDATGGNEPFWLEYVDGDIPVYIQAYYNGGLEGEWDIRNQWVMDFDLRLLATSPMFYEDNQDVTEIYYKGDAILNSIVGRINGEWNNMNYGIHSSVGNIEIGKKGEIYAVADIYIINDNILAVNPLAPAFRIVYWDGTQWVTIASSFTGSAVNDISVAPNGGVYVTGAFTNIDGVAANNIAYWDGSTWYPLSTGLDDDGLHVQVAPNGNVYAGGKFHTAGGVAAYHIARWDGSSWHKLGAQSGLNDEVYSMAISKDGKTIYVGGVFTDQYSLSGSAMLRIAKYNVSSDAFTAMGNGFNYNVNEVIISPSNYVYAGGGFTLSGIATMNYISKWNGSAWEQLGNGLTGGAVLSFAISDKGDIVAVGDFTGNGDMDMKGIALWNGSSWTNLDIIIRPGNDTVQTLTVLFVGEDIIIGGYDFSETPTGSTISIFSDITYVTNNGSAEVRPVVYIKGQAKLRYIENQTSKKKIWFNLDVLEDEEIFIDFGAGKFYSTVRGDLYYALLAGSDLHSFTLIPGENKIAFFMHDDVNAVVRMSYVPVHWGVDGTMHGETF